MGPGPCRRVIGRLYDVLSPIHFIAGKKNPRIFRYEDF
ncbi:hypothetical protein AK973_5323 [Pseudomonas brassicacearum]|nr:hypothetical protein AK973_5323 [Pseudomonas brassicacearum]